MRTTRTLSVTLPPDVLTRAEEMARRENRTVAELLTEALRHYERSQWWAKTNARGRAKAGQLGLTEADVDTAVKAVRKARAQRRLSAR